MLSDPSETYAILSRLGQGSFGSVWLAAERESGRVVAIKVLPLESAKEKHASRGGKSWLQRLRDELSLLRSVGNDCPAVVRFYGAYVTSLLECVWLVMEACECSALDVMRDLSEPLGGGGAAAAVMGGILRALAYLHGRGVIHRDVKASNVLLSRAGDSKLADLGVAGTLGVVRSRGRHTQPGPPSLLHRSPAAEEHTHLPSVRPLHRARRSGARLWARRSGSHLS